MPTKNKAEVCAHCGRPGPMLCDRCLLSGHEGRSMFGCAKCVSEWRNIDAQISAVCGRNPTPVKVIDAEALAG